MYYIHYSCQTVMNLEVSRQVFEKSSEVKFHENQAIGNQVVPYRQMDGRRDGQTLGS
jgi:hypothetical protein